MRKSFAIKLLRAKKGLTQIELAELIGVHELTVRRWELNHTEPRVSDVKRLCEVLGVTESELLNGPSEDVWELRIRVKSELGREAIEMTPNMPCIATLDVTQEGAFLGVQAKWETFRDDEKFADLVRQFTEARALALETGDKLQKIKGEGVS